jgi:hypothetical protein
MVGTMAASGAMAGAEPTTPTLAQPLRCVPAGADGEATH